MAVITMTREMGTLGKDVAAEVADAMGLEVIHHELVEHDIAERTALQESDVHRFLEGTPSLMQRWKAGRSALARCTAEEVFELAARGNVLIRGWGATALLRAVPHVLQVRVCAPMAFRVHVLQKRLELADEKVARREIELNDAAHTRVARGLGIGDWENPLDYDLVLNTERVPVSECARHVRLLAEHPAFEESERSRQVLDDLAIAARLRSAHATDRELGSAIRNLDITVDHGRVRVSGVVQNAALGVELCRNLEAVPGVRSLENRLFAPGAYTG